ncbi:MAG: M2 family metallopeptidase [Candidatus Korobacteraceae bacterium]
MASNVLARLRVLATVLFSTVIAVAAVAQSAPARGGSAASAAGGAPTVEEARQFMDQVNQTLQRLSTMSGHAQWIQSTYIIEDSEIVAADYNEKFIAETTRFIEEAQRFKNLQMPPELARQFKLLELALTMPAPQNPKEREELTQIASRLEGAYGRGKYCPKTGPYEGKCLGQSEMEQAFAVTRDADVLKDLWVGWRTISPQLRQPYSRLVELSNKGAQEIGFRNTSDLWRSNYDMSPEEFTREIHRLWAQVRPLYESLHGYVRRKLVEKYGPQAVTSDGMIRADLLGNIWGQQWGNVYDLVAPPERGASYDLTKLLQAKNLGPKDMVKYGENFFLSLGFKPLPETFWERSLFTKPQDRDVVCHASAWNVDNEEDLRLKMCIQIRDEDFVTIHHELGHNFYQRAYNKQPLLFRGGANDGFHEAIGDAIALSMTPDYLNKVGLLAMVPQPSREQEIGLLLREGLDKIAFLPFGMMIDEWRWRVFSGEVTPANYNQAWWDMRHRYQGITAPVPRSEKDFDPGAKYHVPGNVPYVRYFLAHLLQFQFYRAMCREAGFTGQLNRCSFYGSKEAGAKLNAMLEMGQSRPWPDALQALTGERQIDGNALMEYFAPLKQWLDEQNRGQKLGWTVPAAR